MDLRIVRQAIAIAMLCFTGLAGATEPPPEIELRVGTRLTYSILEIRQPSLNSTMPSDVEGWALSSGSISTPPAPQITEHIVQINVVSKSNESIAIESRKFTRDLKTGLVMPSDTEAFVGKPTDSGLFVDRKSFTPHFCGNARTSDAVAWEPIAYVLDGKSLGALRRTSSAATWQAQQTYERETGLLLEGTQHADLAEAGGTVRRFVHMRLVSNRVVSLPWSGCEMSQAARELKSLKFVGHMISRGVYFKEPVEQDISMRFDVSVADEGFLLGRTTLSLTEAPTDENLENNRLFGSHQTDSLWIAPDATAALTLGQLLDEDAYTGVRAIVSDISENTVTITEQSAAYRLGLIYNRGTGLLISGSLEERASDGRSMFIVAETE